MRYCYVVTFLLLLIVILCHSVIHSDCPPQQGYVRAWLQSNVCFSESNLIRKNVFFVTYECDFD